VAPRHTGRPANTVLRGLTLGVIYLVAWGGGGCSRSTHPVPEGGQQVLNIYNWADYIGNDTIAEFERRTHIKVVMDFYDSNEALEAKLLVGDAGYDIVSTSTAFYGRQIRAGVYAPLDRGKLRNWRNLDPQVLAVQERADPGNRYAVPYLHAMNGFAYNVDQIKARYPAAPTDSLAMLFDPGVISRFGACGVTFLDSPEDVIELAMLYLHLNPNSRSAQDLQAAERAVMAVRPFIRTFDSSDYEHQLASGEICLAIAWSSDYEVAQQRANEAHTGVHLAFTLPKEGSNITYNAMLIPTSAPHREAAHQFLNFILDPKIIAAISNDIRYGNDNLAAAPFVDPALLRDPAVYPPPEVRKNLYLPEEVTPEYERLRTRVWTHIKTGQ
jgi:putrescine transport system substrate-binding protein